MAWDPGFVNPNIDAIGMTYGYMRNYEDRVRRAVNTPDRNGRCALWQGGMEPNIPVGSAAGVAAGMRRAKAGGEREQLAGASGKWVAHWKMVHIVRPVWEEAGADNQLGREFPPLTYTQEDADGLVLLEPAPRTVRGARDLLSVALQYGNAFRRGFPGGGAQARRLFRQRRRALSDGGHGDRRDPRQHPLGVAAQGRATHRGRPRDGRQGRRHVRRSAFCAAARRGVREAARRAATATSTTIRRRPRCPSRARSSRPTWPIASSCRGTSICLNLNLEQPRSRHGADPASALTSRPSSETERGLPRISILPV